MAMDNYKKIENEAGYPVYIDNLTGKQQYDHPEFVKIIKSIEEYDGIKYSAYRTAFKICALQRHLQVPPLRISSGVFARHQLSLSETTLSLDTSELEAVLGDIYFAAEKEGHFSGDVDLVVDLLINLLLNVFDKERKEPVRLLAAKTLLICLSEEPVAEKWAALANCSADHNGCVSGRRLASLLTHVAALPHYLGSTAHVIQADVDACFANNAGMLGMTSRAVGAWGAAECRSTRWLCVAHRVATRHTRPPAAGACSACLEPLTQVLNFQCTKCSEVYFCEKCYLYDKNLTVRGHKKTHPVHEIVDGQPKPPVCLSFIKGMKRFFFCTKTKKRKCTKPTKTRVEKETGSTRKRKDVKGAIFTSTVGKASGHKDNPTVMLQDIINQLESQYKVVLDVARQVEEVSACKDEGLKNKVESHWTQVSAQIQRLKILKDNLTSSQMNLPSAAETPEHPQAFDLFSPIPVLEERQSKFTDNNKKQPRVLSLDSGNFSVVSKNATQNLLTVSGDALKPVTMTSDSISAVSINDISSWYNETKQTEARGTLPDAKPPEVAVCDMSDTVHLQTCNNKIQEANTDLDTVLDRLQHLLTHNFAMDEWCVDNSVVRARATEVEGLLSTLIQGVEHRHMVHANTRYPVQTTTHKHTAVLKEAL